MCDNRGCDCSDATDCV